MFSKLRLTILALSAVLALQAATPDISNLNNCIQEVRNADNFPPEVPTFDPYTQDYSQLISDLEAASPHLPHVYQVAAAKPLIQFLQNLGEDQYLEIFSQDPTDENTAVLQQMIPDAALAILYYEGTYAAGVNAFQEVVSDLYDGFFSQESLVAKQTNKPIDPPKYGMIPPLVKFGNAEDGPYTWPCDSTYQVLGMLCPIVNLPPAEMTGGLIAWTSLGHETGGHDITHADSGLLDELAKKVYDAVYAKFKLKALANYWANCIDETTADICGYLNIGPSAAIGLIGYFRALGNGKLRTLGYTNDPHPIDLLRGYVGASVVKRLHFKGAADWSQAITNETNKDAGPLFFMDQRGIQRPFPVSLKIAISSADLVAQTILESKLDALQQYSLQDLQDWTDIDQAIVDELSTAFKNTGKLPKDLQGPGFYAAYVVAAATQTALERGENVSNLFQEMQSFLIAMHSANPTWSQTPTKQSKALLEKVKANELGSNDLQPHYVLNKQTRKQKATALSRR